VNKKYGSDFKYRHQSSIGRNIIRFSSKFQNKKRLCSIYLYRNNNENHINMKILVIDDQELVILSLSKCLMDLGYEVKSANNLQDAITTYDEFNPNLVITDINMPVIRNSSSNFKSLDYLKEVSGLEIVKYVKVIKKHSTPVMILSGNNDEDIILKGFELGAIDYMKKPLSLNEIGARVKRLIGANEVVAVDNSNRLIQNNCIGVVIPCYNEEERLSSEEFKRFVHSNLGYHLCFVNDGSKDNTLATLQELCKGNEDRISIYNCEKNGGKAEAVRLGMLHLAKDNQYNYIGFLDADLSTNFDDFKELVNTISNSKYKIVSGSRINRMGADIAKESARKIISQCINFIIRKTLGMDFQDTQCGAKIMNREIIDKTFQKKFLTKWLFDVEIFMRMKKIYGKEEAINLICEQPLNRWVHMDGSKLSFRDSFKIVGQIGQIALHYN
jgi:CheY-like chemotaxis protein